MEQVALNRHVKCDREAIDKCDRRAIDSPQPQLITFMLENGGVVKGKARWAP